MEEVARISGELEKKSRRSRGWVGAFRALGSGGGSGAWKRYWFVLHGRLLTYYKRGNSGVPHDLSPCRGTINLGTARCVRLAQPPRRHRRGRGVPDPPPRHVLHVVHGSGHVVQLRADTRADLERWLAALLEAVSPPAAASPLPPPPASSHRDALFHKIARSGRPTPFATVSNATSVDNELYAQHTTWFVRPAEDITNDIYHTINNNTTTVENEQYAQHTTCFSRLAEDVTNDIYQTINNNKEENDEAQYEYVSPASIGSARGAGTSNDDYAMICNEQYASFARSVASGGGNEDEEYATPEQVGAQRKPRASFIACKSRRVVQRLWHGLTFRHYFGVKQDDSCRRPPCDLPPSTLEPPMYESVPLATPQVLAQLHNRLERLTTDWPQAPVDESRELLRTRSPSAAADLDRILDQLGEQRHTVKELVDKFDSTEVVELRHSTHGGELAHLLEQLARVTQAPLVVRANINSLPPSCDDSSCDVMKEHTKQRRNSEPDYDVPRPHGPTQQRRPVSPASSTDDAIPATRFFGSPLQPPATITPDSLDAPLSAPRPTMHELFLDSLEPPTMSTNDNSNSASP